jgi:hypothetical protein
VLLLAAVMTVLAYRSEPPNELPGSVGSTEQDGRRALQLLLEELGFETVAWRQPPGSLPPGERLLWLAALPDAVEQRDTPRDLTHYRGFVQAGGRLAVAVDGAQLARLEQELGFTELAGLALTEDTSGPRRVDARWLTGETLALQQRAHFEALPAGARALLAGGGGQPYAIEVPCGSGALVLLADDAWLENGRLGALDHGLLAVRLAEHGARERAVLFDEYALGRWRPSSALSLALGPPARPFTLHLLLLALVCVWRVAWVREFPRDPEALEQVAPLSRARAQAALFVRARRHDLLAGMLRHGALSRAAARLRLRLPALPLDAAAADARLAADLDALSAAAGRPLPAAWREALLERHVTHAAGLERLAHDLDRLESELGGSERLAARARPGQALRLLHGSHRRAEH